MPIIAVLFEEVIWSDRNRNLKTLIAIVISKLLRRRLKAKRRAPDYSRVLRQIRRPDVQRIVCGRIGSDWVPITRHHLHPAPLSVTPGLPLKI